MNIILFVLNRQFRMVIMKYIYRSDLFGNDLGVNQEWYCLFLSMRIGTSSGVIFSQYIMMEMILIIIIIIIVHEYNIVIVIRPEKIASKRITVLVFISIAIYLLLLLYSLTITHDNYILPCDFYHSLVTKTNSTIKI